MERAGRGFKDLVAWQRGISLVEQVYDSSRSWPADERFGLVAQIRRAAVSVPSNVAEGNARTGTREFLHHVSIAFGSLAEVETHVVIAERLGFLDKGHAQQLYESVINARRPLFGLIRSLRDAAA